MQNEGRKTEGGVSKVAKMGWVVALPGHYASVWVLLMRFLGQNYELSELKSSASVTLNVT